MLGARASCGIFPLDFLLCPDCVSLDTGVDLLSFAAGAVKLHLHVQNTYLSSFSPSGIVRKKSQKERVVSIKLYECPDVSTTDSMNACNVTLQAA